MKQLPELVKAIQAKWDVTVGDYTIPLYHLTSPQGTDYPLATFTVVSAPAQYAMGSAGTAVQYRTPQVQISLYLTASQMANGVGWQALDAVEGLYNQQALTLEGGRWMGCLLGDTAVTYYEDEEKIYRLTQTFRFWIGE